MKAFSLALAIVGVVVVAGQVAADPLVLDFESLTPRDTALGANFWVSNPGFETGGATFSGGDYQGFVVSSSTTTGTTGYLFEGGPSAAAEISAQSNGGAGGGVDESTNFAVGYNATSFVNLPAGYRPSSVYATNVATTAWLLANPDPNGFAKPLSQNGEEFSVTFRGWSLPGAQGTQLGSSKFVLGSYSGGAASIVNAWTLVDLASLGDAASIDLMFASYDVNLHGIVTPTYVAIDNLTLTPVPEPSSILLAACGGILALGVWRRRCRRQWAA